MMCTTSTVDIATKRSPSICDTYCPLDVLLFKWPGIAETKADMRPESEIIFMSLCSLSSRETTRESLAGHRRAKCRTARCRLRSQRKYRCLHPAERRSSCTPDAPESFGRQHPGKQRALRTQSLPPLPDRLPE